MSRIKYQSSGKYQGTVVCRHKWFAKGRLKKHPIISLTLITKKQDYHRRFLPWSVLTVWNWGVGEKKNMYEENLKGTVSLQFVTQFSPWIIFPHIIPSAPLPSIFKNSWKGTKLSNDTRYLS
jgi:hypothetical protein